MFKLLYIVLILHTSKIMLKIFQARFQQYMNRELPHVQTGFRIGRGTKDQTAKIHRIIEEVKWSQVKSLSRVRLCDPMELHI